MALSTIDKRFKDFYAAHSIKLTHSSQYHTVELGDQMNSWYSSAYGSKVGRNQGSESSGSNNGSLFYQDGPLC